LNALRENWLNPPEWTRTEVLEYPGTVGGPWDHYIDPSTIHHPPSTISSQPFSIGTVRYPRLVPRTSGVGLEQVTTGLGGDGGNIE
jgi:hypothetical protein